MDLHEIFEEGWQWAVNKRLNLGGDPDHGSRSVSRHW